jgi:hypothetical protein
MIGTMSLLLIVMWGIFIFGVLTENDIFIFIGGCGFLLMTVEIMPNGLEGINNFVTRGLAFIQIGVGTIAILTPIFNFGNWN